jgi:peptide/nickel transport system ATP-binding protein
MEPLLDVDGLSVTLPTPNGALQAVRNISFNVKAGETLGIVGESGCGKSMTALALLGLQPSRARRTATWLTFAGHDLQRLSNGDMNRLRGDALSMIFQEPMTSLNPVYTVGDQLTGVYRQHRKASMAEARKRAVYLLERVGVTAPESRLKQYPHELSGGLRQRIVIAMALMCGPKLMLADEPTTALDVTIQCDLLRLLVELRQEFGMAMIFISHDLGIVSRMADRVAVMYAGQIVEHGPVEQVFNDPLHLYTRGLLACLPESADAGRQARLPSIPGTIPSLIGDLTGCSFRERCAKAMPQCAEQSVEQHQATADHAYRCLLTPETLRVGALT